MKTINIKEKAAGFLSEAGKKVGRLKIVKKPDRPDDGHELGFPESGQGSGGAGSGSPGNGMAGFNGFRMLFRKELADHLNSKRLILIFALLMVTGAASLGGALSNLRDVISEGDSGFVFIKLFTTNGDSIYSFMTFLAFLGPLAGITLGFDAVCSERSQGTLIRLVSQPIYRDSIINAKFLAGSATAALVVFALGITVGCFGLIFTGITPSFEEICRILVFLLLSWVYISFWLGLSILFSVLCRHAATSALAGISVWLFFALFMSLVASGIANFIYPTGNIAGYENLLKNYTLNLGLNRLSPYYLFGEAAATILDPNVRTVSIISQEQISGAIAGYLPFGQSLMLIWPHLVAMTAFSMAGFAVAYIFFMRQEIRA